MAKNSANPNQSYGTSKQSKRDQGVMVFGNDLRAGKKKKKK